MTSPDPILADGVFDVPLPRRERVHRMPDAIRLEVNGPYGVLVANLAIRPDIRFPVMRLIIGPHAQVLPHLAGRNLHAHQVDERVSKCLVRMEAAASKGKMYLVFREFWRLKHGFSVTTPLSMHQLRRWVRLCIRKARRSRIEIFDTLESADLAHMTRNYANVRKAVEVGNLNLRWLELWSGRHAGSRLARWWQAYRHRKLGLSYRPQRVTPPPLNNISPNRYDFREYPLHLPRWRRNDDEAVIDMADDDRRPLRWLFNRFEHRSQISWQPYVRPGIDGALDRWYQGRGFSLTPSEKTWMEDASP